MPTGIYKHNPLSAEHRKKISLARKGKARPEIQGSNCYNWKGGISKVITSCLQCRSAFVTKQCHLKKGLSKYCSRNCYGKWMSKNMKSSRSHSWKGGINKTKRVCIECAKDFVANTTDVRKGWGKYCSRSCRAKSKKGVESANWMGGITPINKAIRNSSKYSEWRKLILIRDDFTCQLCQRRGGDLNVDHIKKFADYPELRFVPSNGRTLCVPCHKQTDTFGGKKINKTRT